MSDNPPASLADIPAANSLIFLAMRDIARATTPDQIVAALREYILPDMDRISLARVERSATGQPVGRMISVWDRDGLAADSELPADVLELVEDQPLVVIDTIYLDEFLAPFKNYAVDLLKASSFGIFPLRLGEQTFGFLVVAARKTHLQNDQEVRALLMLGWQMAAMLQGQNLAEKLQTQAQREATFAGLCQAIAAALNYDALGQTLGAGLGNIFALEHLSLTLRAPDSSETKVITWHGAELANHAMLTGSLVDQVIKSGETAFLDGMGGPQDGAESVKGGVQKLLLIPLSDHAERLGTLNIGIGAGAYFGAEERRLCETVAPQVSAALTNIQLVEQLQQSLEETTTLYSTALALTASQSIEEVYSTALSEIAHFSGADRITLYLAGPDLGETVDYVDAAAIWKSNKLVIPSGLRYPIAEAPVLSQFPQSRSNLIFNAIGEDERLADGLRRYYVEEGVSALMMIPISTPTNWLGALLVEAGKGQSFTGEQSRVCRSLADQAALALDSQLLLANTRQVIAQERSLRDITDRIRRSHAIDEIMAITTEELSKILGIGPEKFDQLSVTDSARLGLSQTERDFVENVSAQVSLAIENLRLLENTRKAAQAEQTISNMTVELQRASEMTDVMSTAVRTLYGALDDYDVRIRLSSPQTGRQRLDAGQLNPEPVSKPEPGKKKSRRKTRHDTLPGD